MDRPLGQWRAHFRAALTARIADPRIRRARRAHRQGCLGRGRGRDVRCNPGRNPARMRRHASAFVSVPQLFGASLAPHAADSAPPEFALPPCAAVSAAALALPRYFRFKRAIDFTTALILIVALLPLWLVIAGLAFVDVGEPILFWQQRIGLGGRNFLLYKIRTLRPAFDRSGRSSRMSSACRGLAGCCAGRGSTSCRNCSTCWSATCR